jgi:hypothetical protein
MRIAIAIMLSACCHDATYTSPARASASVAPLCAPLYGTTSWEITCHELVRARIPHATFPWFHATRVESPFTCLQKMSSIAIVKDHTYEFTCAFDARSNRVTLEYLR